MTCLLLRADASSQIGTGHLMRCLALAQAWQDAGGQVVFLMATEAPALAGRLQAEGMEVVRLPAQPGSANDARRIGALAREIGAPWVVVDGYHFGAEYQHIIKDSRLGLLLIDDIGHAGHYYADIVLNQNLHAHEGFYANREPYIRLLLGTRYVLLRREFLKWRGWERENPQVARRVLVTLGGGDPDNVTLKVIQALRQVEVEGLETLVVVGDSNPHYEILQSAIRHLPFAVRLERNVSDMPELMAWADMAISAGGSTCLELAFMGLPNLILVLAENQRAIAENLNAAGVAVNLGWHEDVTSGLICQALNKLVPATETRTKMSALGQELVDGKGSERVVKSIMVDRLTLRPVQEKDCELIWKWANDPDVRAGSISSVPIPWNEHVRWFKSKLNDPHCFFYVAINKNGIPVGQVRFDKKENENIISVSVDNNLRGHGYGSIIIESASQKFFEVSGAQGINAYIKQGNEASKRAFVRAGFKYLGITTNGGESMIRLRLQRNNRA